MDGIPTKFIKNGSTSKTYFTLCKTCNILKNFDFFKFLFWFSSVSGACALETYATVISGVVISV